MDIDNRKVMEFQSIRPNKLVVYNRDINRIKSAATSNKSLKNWTDEERAVFGLPAKKERNINKHNFELSKSAQKTLQEKITWLYYYAKKRTITTHNNKVLADFKMNFVTLKLPSEQKHSSDFITKNCLNQLLVELSKKISLKNYVWRLEYQKNGNLHYHIAMDKYIDYRLLRNIWNRILSKYGYVQAYTEKFSKMQIHEYIKLYFDKDKNDFATLEKRFAEGCRTKWKTPNTVDVKMCTNSKAVAFYISKYFGKNSSTGSEKKLQVNEENSGNSRLWFCSRSLSKLKAISDMTEALGGSYAVFLEGMNNVKKLICDYCIVYYFNIKDLCNNGKRAFYDLFKNYGIETGYLDAPPAKG